MKIVAIIPSRYGSTRFEGKPLALIAGKPMIQWVCERTKQAENITDVLVATDDTRIFDTVRHFGGKALITSKDNRSGTDRLAQAAEIIGLDMDDIVVNVQGDQPLIDPRCLDQVVNPLKSEIENWLISSKSAKPADLCFDRLNNLSPAFEMTTLAFKIVNEAEISNPKDVKVVFDNKGFALYFSRSPIPCARDASTHFDIYKHLGVYAYTRRFLEIFRHLPESGLEAIEKLEQLRVLEHGHKIMTVVTEYDSPEVDIPDDIARIENILTEMN